MVPTESTEVVSQFNLGHNVYTNTINTKSLEAYQLCMISS